MHQSKQLAEHFRVVHTFLFFKQGHEEKTAKSDKNSTILSIQCGSIEEEFIDVLVNPLSTGTETNPLVQVLSKKAGETLKILCSQLVESLIVDEAKSVFTKASGKLRCKKLLHVYNPNQTECHTDTLQAVVLNALCHAEKEQYSSICLPLFGSGYSLEEKAHTIFQACSEFGQRAPVSLKKIVLVTAEDYDYDKVCSCLSSFKSKLPMYMNPAPESRVNSMDLQQFSWVQSKRRSLQPWETKDLKMLEDEDAIIDIYCCVPKQGDSIIDDIINRLMQRLVTEDFKDDHIQYLIASEVNDIKSYASELGVTVTMTKQQNRISLSGEKGGVEVVKTYITKVLASLKHTKMSLNQVVWHRITDGGIETIISEEVSFQLESARVKV